MASHAVRLIAAAWICPVLLACGCSVAGHSFESLINRGEIAREVVRKKAEYHADRKQADLEYKLAAQEDRLRQLETGTSTDLETTMAMEVNQSIEFEEITVDVEEMKKVIARAEARARAEALRLKRQPQLLRDQEEALRQGGAAVQEVGVVQPAQFNGGVQAGNEADMVVAVDEFGNPLPFVEEPTAQIAPWEIPLNMRLRLNLGVNNPRVQGTRVRRRPMNPSAWDSSPSFWNRCGRCSKKGCSACQKGCDECSRGCQACAETASGDSHLQPAPADGPETIAAKPVKRDDPFQTVSQRIAAPSTTAAAAGIDIDYAAAARLAAPKAAPSRLPAVTASAE